MTTISTPDGLVLVDKPAGISSHDVALVARRALGERRIGHAGTLDPFATGLLVLLVGRATRLLPFLPGDPKVYEATITFGSETATEDLLGEVTQTSSLPSQDAVLTALPSFTGTVSHVPPVYSAKHVGGQRAYQLARSGRDVELAATVIRVDAWEMLSWAGEPDAVTACDVRITCGPGTYVRALARDLGRAAGSTAHLGALRRTRSGPFGIERAVSLEQLRTEGRAVLRPPTDALPGMPHEVLSADAISLVVRGQPVAATIAGPRAALMNGQSGVMVALAERVENAWQPRVVMRAADESAT